eukprot:6807-Heterococcus_DN1.PRE.1
MDPDDAMKDFLARIAAYKKVYEPLKKEEGVSFIRLTNAGEELLTYQCSGYTLGRISWLMGSVHTGVHLFKYALSCCCHCLHARVQRVLLCVSDAKSIAAAAAAIAVCTEAAGYYAPVAEAQL